MLPLLQMSALFSRKGNNEAGFSMYKIVIDSTLRQKMSSSSRRIISNFTVEHTARGVKEAISYAAKT